MAFPQIKVVQIKCWFMLTNDKGHRSNELRLLGLALELGTNQENTFDAIIANRFDPNCAFASEA